LNRVEVREVREGRKVCGHRKAAAAASALEIEAADGGDSRATAARHIEKGGLTKGANSALLI
jgi:hypothetical protein